MTALPPLLWKSSCTKPPRSSCAINHWNWAKKDLWHGALIKISRQKGYARGCAAHKFREKFGHWPTLNYPPEHEPTLEILNWVRSRNIAYARTRQVLSSCRSR
jgi:hypothetical protein